MFRYHCSTSEDEEAEEFYKNVSTAIKEEKAHYKLVIGECNAKIGGKINEDTEHIGRFGVGTRNERGNMLMNLLKGEQLYCMNTFFKKPPHSTRFSIALTHEVTTDLLEPK